MEIATEEESAGQAFQRLSTALATEQETAELTDLARPELLDQVARLEAELRPRLHYRFGLP